MWVHQGSPHKVAEDISRFLGLVECADQSGVYCAHLLAQRFTRATAAPQRRSRKLRNTGDEVVSVTIIVRALTYFFHVCTTIQAAIKAFRYHHTLFRFRFRFMFVHAVSWLPMPLNFPTAVSRMSTLKLVTTGTGRLFPIRYFQSDRNSTTPSTFIFPFAPPIDHTYLPRTMSNPHRTSTSISKRSKRKIS